jgi:hypothetical protein
MHRKVQSEKLTRKLAKEQKKSQNPPLEVNPRKSLLLGLKRGFLAICVFRK